MGKVCTLPALNHPMGLRGRVESSRSGALEQDLGDGCTDGEDDE